MFKNKDKFSKISNCIFLVLFIMSICTIINLLTTNFEEVKEDLKDVFGYSYFAGCFFDLL